MSVPGTLTSRRHIAEPLITGSHIAALIDCAAMLPIYSVITAEEHFRLT
jgi:hypothetical protein